MSFLVEVVAYRGLDRGEFLPSLSKECTSSGWNWGSPAGSVSENAAISPEKSQSPKTQSERLVFLRAALRQPSTVYRTRKRASDSPPFSVIGATAAKGGFEPMAPNAALYPSCSDAA